MKRSGDQALDQALALHESPGHLAEIRHLDLPKDLQTLLRIAAGDLESTMQAARRSGESPETLREVAIFYLQQLLFADDGDSYRVLGVDPDAADEQIKLHYRWLVRWLHPDRNSDEWETVFAERVNLAWQDLRTPTRRNAYDLRLGAENELPSNRSREDSPNLIRTAVSMPILSARTVRWLPTLVLGGFGLFAIVALGLLYKLQVMDQEARSPAPSLAEVERAQTQPAFAARAVDVEPPPLVTAPNSPPTASIAPVPMPTPTPMPVSPKPAAAPIAASNPTMPAPSEANQIAEAIETPATKPVPSKPIYPSRAQPIARPQQPISRETETRYLAVAAASNNAVNPVSEKVDSEAAPSVSNQAPATELRMTESVATAAVQPGRQDVSFQMRQDSPHLIDDRIAASLVSRFSQAYANGDMERLMQLFTHDAQNGRGDRRAIAEDYQHLFESSDRRRIAVSDMSWLAVGNGATIIASFETEVVPHGKVHGEHATGDIRFDLRQEDGELRIYRLSHDNRRS